MSKLVPGTFKAVLTDWGVTKAKTGTPGVVCSFSVAVGEDLVQSDKIYYLTEKSKAFSIERLYALGFNGNLDDLAGGRPKSALTGGIEVQVTCDNETFDGETRCRIQFVNLPGESHGITKVDPKEGAGLLAGFKADFLSLKPVTKGKKLDI